MSMTVQPFHGDVFVFAVCRDAKLRMWSTSTFECACVEDLVNGNSSGSGSGALLQGSQNHLIRKFEDGINPKNVLLGFYLSFARNSRFCVFRPCVADGQTRLEHLATVFTPDGLNLVDFCVSRSQIWALWTDLDTETPVLRYAYFDSGSPGLASDYFEEPAGDDGEGGWKKVVLEEPPEPEVPPENPDYDDDSWDPKEAFLQQIFYPGRFTLTTLAKTLNIYRRAKIVPTDEGGEGQGQGRRLTADKLKEEIVSAVEHEIASNHASSNRAEYRLSEDEYHDLASSAWQRFYSGVLQYHAAGAKSLGLVTDLSGGLYCLIKKQSVSFFRTMDALEQLALQSDVAIGPEIFYDTPVLREEPSLAQDVIHLMRAVALVNAFTPVHLVREFSRSLTKLASPDVVAKKIVDVILTEGTTTTTANNSFAADFYAVNFTQELSKRLQQVKDVSRALEVILVSLELDRGIVSHSANSRWSGFEAVLGRGPFASTVGVSVVAESLKQLTSTRFHLTRDLIVLQLLMLECGLLDGKTASGHVDFDLSMTSTGAVDATEVVHSTFLPRTVVMAHCYFVMTWLSETKATAPAPNSLEQGLRQLAVLKISERSSSQEDFVQLAKLSAHPLTLAELFLRGAGGSRARALLGTAETLAEDNSKPWHCALSPLINIAAQLLWPRCAVPTFQEFLLSACQHGQIQEYVRLLSTWCDWNCHSRQFLLGSALLHSGEADQAAQWMVQAAGGIPSDSFLMSQIFGAEELDRGDQRRDLQVQWIPLKKTTSGQQKLVSLSEIIIQ